VEDEYKIHVEPTGAFGISHAPPGISIRVHGAEAISVGSDEAQEIIKQLRQHRDGVIFDKQTRRVVPKRPSEDNKGQNRDEGEKPST